MTRESRAMGWMTSGLDAMGLVRRPSAWVAPVTIGAAVAVGGAVGAGLALLFAPSSGAQLRRDAGAWMHRKSARTEQVGAHDAQPNGRERVASDAA